MAQCATSFARLGAAGGVAATDLGARQVERILHNIEHDLPV